MSRHTTFRLALDPTASQEQALSRHAGASRFAYNQSLSTVKDALEARSRGKDVKVPWSGFDLINAFNSWKGSPDAGTDDEGNPGLAWRGEVCAQVFEEAAVDCGKALKAFWDSKQGKRKGKRVGFPRFKKRGRCRESCRLRNKVDRRTGRSSIRVGDTHPRSVTLPVLGQIRVHDQTRALRRLIRRDAKICFATIRRHGRRWYVSLNVEAPDLNEARRVATDGPVVGIDRGLKTFVVAAYADGTEIARAASPKPLRRALRAYRRHSRTHSRRKRGSVRRRAQAERLRRIHARIADVRRHFLHQVSGQLTKTHGRICLEDLNVAGMVRNRHLARDISDSAWAELARQIEYKLAWTGGELIPADRFYPSSKMCSACGAIDDDLGLSDRTFNCASCGAAIDRDLNAAINLAVWGEQRPDRHREALGTKTARGREGAGHDQMIAVQPARMKREPATASTA